jgi:hypothetical protein
MPDDDSEVFVDLSNVAKHELLGYSQHHAALSRWDRLRSVWLRTRGEPRRFALIADDSLLKALPRQDQIRLQDLVHREELRVVPNADVELLGEASRVGGTVLSNDRFVDHLRMPNIDRVKLVGWTVRGSNVLLVERPLERLRSAIISARLQKQELKDAGLAEDSPELGFRWYCNESGCDNDLVPIPAIRGGTPVCPSCEAYLERGHEWRTPIWIKIMHRDEVVNRFVLEDGESVFVGRGTDEDTVSLAEAFTHASDVLALDHKHVELQNREGRLYAFDRGTAHGTSLRYPVAGQRNILSPPLPLVPGEEKLVPIGWKLVLARTPFTIQISGRQGVA